MRFCIPVKRSSSLFSRNASISDRCNSARRFKIALSVSLIFPTNSSYLDFGTLLDVTFPVLSTEYIITLSGSDKSCSIYTNPSSLSGNCPFFSWVWVLGIKDRSWYRATPLLAWTWVSNGPIIFPGTSPAAAEDWGGIGCARSSGWNLVPSTVPDGCPPLPAVCAPVFVPFFGVDGFTDLPAVPPDFPPILTSGISVFVAALLISSKLRASPADPSATTLPAEIPFPSAETNFCTLFNLERVRTAPAPHFPGTAAINRAADAIPRAMAGKALISAGIESTTTATSASSPMNFPSSRAS